MVMIDEGGGGTAGRAGVLSIANQTEAERALIDYLVANLEQLSDRLHDGARPADCQALKSACRVLADELGTVMSAERVTLFRPIDGYLGPNRVTRAMAAQHSTIEHLTGLVRQLAEGLDGSDDDRRRSCRGCLKELTVALLVHRHQHEEAVAALALTGLATL